MSISLAWMHQSGHNALSNSEHQSMYISPAPMNADVRRIQADGVASQGFLMNLTHVWAWRPEVFEGFAALRSQLTGNSTLTKRELAVIVSATASALGDSYCSLAWGTMLAKQSQPNVAAAVLRGNDDPELAPRDRALAAWARKVAKDPVGATAADVQALRDAGFAEREIVEATMLVAFRIAFSTVNNALGAHPDPELASSAPAEVARAVSFGRAPQKYAVPD
jgi:uncharacterized peroxidase-related enzyme